MRSIRYSGFGVRSVGPVGDFLEGLNYFVFQPIRFDFFDLHREGTFKHQVLTCHQKGALVHSATVSYGTANGGFPEPYVRLCWGWENSLT